jgi:hypothetical protein
MAHTMQSVTRPRDCTWNLVVDWECSQCLGETRWRRRKWSEKRVQDELHVMAHLAPRCDDCLALPIDPTVAHMHPEHYQPMAVADAFWSARGLTGVLVFTEPVKVRIIRSGRCSSRVLRGRVVPFESDDESAEAPVPKRFRNGPSGEWPLLQLPVDLDA